MRLLSALSCVPFLFMIPPLMPVLAQEEAPVFRSQLTAPIYFSGESAPENMEDFVWNGSHEAVYHVREGSSEYVLPIDTSGAHGAVSWSISPSGSHVEVDASGGLVLSADAVGALGTFMLTGTDGIGRQISSSFELSGYAHIAISTPGGQQRYVGEAFSTSAPVASGGSPGGKVFSLHRDSDGALANPPAGTSFNTETGVLSGTPSAASNILYRLRVSDARGDIATSNAFRVQITQATAANMRPSSVQIQHPSRVTFSASNLVEALYDRNTSDPAFTYQSSAGKSNMGYFVNFQYPTRATTCTVVVNLPSTGTLPTAIYARAQLASGGYTAWETTTLPSGSGIKTINWNCGIPGGTTSITRVQVSWGAEANPTYLAAFSVTETRVLYNGVAAH